LTASLLKIGVNQKIAPDNGGCMTTYVESIYLRGNKYYFQYTDRTGKRRQKSTGTPDKKLALEIAQVFVKRLALGYDDSQTLGSMLEQFSDKKTNPRYLQAQITKESYSELYAERVGYRAKHLLKIFPASLLGRSLSYFTRPDMRDICLLILNQRGRTRAAQQDFQLVKAIFRQAVDDGYIPYSPATKMSDIKYEEEKKEAIPAENIAWLLSHPEFFPKPISYDFFFVLATTGMRRGEVLGIKGTKIFNGVLTIDQQYTVKGKFAEPKMGVVRVIPLAKITREVLENRKPDKIGRLFPLSHSMVGNLFTAIRMAAMANDPINADMWSKLNPHLLRHSLNTNLLVDGQKPINVAEYLAWHHQELLTMQQRYTHLVAMNLKSIADAVDRLYMPDAIENTKII